ncbi:hypothetical protein GOODEAATRI_025287 [Goodea atripinnis]|uniref:Myosin motor domain-containing protein n=1 Tax=Goodea atripinnis TaxID=208336 RepID=A0ABV0MNL7_9TELE
MAVLKAVSGTEGACLETFRTSNWTPSEVGQQRGEAQWTVCYDGGFPSRAPFHELYNMYQKYMPPKLTRLDPRLFCKALFKALGLDENDYKFGLTKVFFRPGKGPQRLRFYPSQAHLFHSSAVSFCLLHTLTLCSDTCSSDPLLLLIPDYKQFGPGSIDGLVKVHNLKKRMSRFNAVVGGLKEGKQEMSKQIQGLENAIDALMLKIKVSFCWLQGASSVCATG